jgi:hypothetical protein
MIMMARSHMAAACVPTPYAYSVTRPSHKQRDPRFPLRSPKNLQNDDMATWFVHPPSETTGSKGQLDLTTTISTATSQGSRLLSPHPHISGASSEAVGGRASYGLPAPAPSASWSDGPAFTFRGPPCGAKHREHRVNTWPFSETQMLGASWY